MKRARMLRWLALAGCLAGTPAFAAEPEEEAPDDAFLEFLAGWEAVDGELIDPVALAELEADGKLADSGIRKPKDVGGDENDES